MACCAGSNGSVNVVQASYKGDLDAVRQIIEEDQELNINKFMGAIPGMKPYGTALAAAAAGGSYPIVEYLVEQQNADVNVEDSIALFMVAPKSDSSTKIMEYLINKGGKVNATISRKGLKKTLIGQHAKSPGQLKLLIEKKADVNYKDKETGMSILAQVAARDAPEAVKALLTAGAKIDDKDNSGNTPLIHSFIGHKERASRVVELKDFPEAEIDLKKDDQGLKWTEEGLKTCRALIDGKADISIKNNEGKRAVDLAMKGTHMPILVALQAAGALDDPKDKEAFDKFVNTTREDQLAMVELMNMDREAWGGDEFQ